MYPVDNKTAYFLSLLLVAFAWLLALLFLETGAVETFDAFNTVLLQLSVSYPFKSNAE